MKTLRSVLIGFIGMVGVLFPQEKDTTFILNGVEITSTRKATTSFNEPMAISIITAKDLFKGRGYGLDEALSLVPGVFAQSRYGNQDVRLTIRGYGARGAGERSNSGTSRGIRILLDGFPETEPDGRTSFDHIDLSTMNRIEVLRSNGSALWGNGAGGVVSISSNTTFDRPFVSLDHSIGQFGFSKSTLQVGTDIGQGKFFLNLSNTVSDGWRKHSSSAQTLLNTGIVAPLGDKTDLGVFILGTTNIFHIPGPLSHKQYDADPTQAQSDTSYYSPTYVKRDERRFNRLGRIGVKLSHGFNADNDISASAYVNPKYLQRSERNTFRDFTRYHVGGNVVYRNRTSLSGDLGVTSTVGTDEAYQDGAILFYQLKNGQRDSILADNKREGANSFGLFLQEDVAIGDKLILSVGARYDDVTYIAENFVTPTNLSDKKSFTKVTPKAGIVYKFAQNHSVYASLGGGVEVPAGNETDPAQGQPNSRSLNPLLEPIVSTTYEVGTKLTMQFPIDFVQWVNYDIAAYTILTENDIVPYQNGRFYLTAGETRRTGIEVSLSAQFEEGLSLMTALTFSDNTYTDYVVDSVYTKRPIAPALSGHTAKYSDNAIVGIPGLLATTRLRYEPSFLSGAYIEGSMHNVGSYYADDANLLNVPAYTIFNGSVGFAGPLPILDGVKIRAFVTMNNLAGTKYVSSAYINPDYGRVSSTSKEAVYIEPGFPRYLIGSVGIDYSF